MTMKTTMLTKENFSSVPVPAWRSRGWNRSRRHSAAL